MSKIFPIVWSLQCSSLKAKLLFEGFRIRKVTAMAKKDTLAIKEVLLKWGHIEREKLSIKFCQSLEQKIC